MGSTSMPGWDVELPEHPSATIAGYFVLYQPSHAPSAIIANRPPTPIWSSPMARMPRRNCSPRGRDRDTSRSSSAGTNVRIKVLRRDAKNHDRQPIRKKPHAAAKPAWMLSLIGGIITLSLSFICGRLSSPSALHNFQNHCVTLGNGKKRKQLDCCFRPKRG
jgi:hypothetical protein